MKKQKGPKPGAAQRLRDAYAKITKRPLSSEAKKEIEDFFREQQKAPAPSPKKIANSDRDVDL